MEKLKILIVTEGDDLCLETVKIVSRLISSLKINAEFYYAKSFIDAFFKEKLMCQGFFDAVFMASDKLDLWIEPITNALWEKDEKTPLFFFSSLPLLVDKIKREESIKLSFLLNEEKTLSGVDFEKAKQAFIWRGKISSRVPQKKLVNPILIFSVLNESDIPTSVLDNGQTKCERIVLKLNKAKIKYTVVVENCCKKIFAEEEDLADIRSISEEIPRFRFWLDWMSKWLSNNL